MTANGYKPANHVRIVTATSLFDGHDAAINIMRRIMQDLGAEVIHLGHNRSADEIVTAAIQEDASALAVSCYQGGHVEFFKYIVELLEERSASHIKVFGGGGGVIVAEEIHEIEAAGVTKIYSPEDGRRLGLVGMIEHLVSLADVKREFAGTETRLGELNTDDHGLIARLITGVEEGWLLPALAERLAARAAGPPVIGLTGPGGAGKSSLLDEFLLRFLADFPKKHVGVLSVDPSRRKTGGALLGDRIRMNALAAGRVYMRSLATRGGGAEISTALPQAIGVLKAVGFDLVIVETAGIGQSGAQAAELADVAIYVMTSEFGAPSQLEKIDMLDYADLVAVNKFDHRSAADALRDVAKQYQRNHALFETALEDMPVYGTIAAKFNDQGVTALYQAALDLLAEKTDRPLAPPGPRLTAKIPQSPAMVIPPERARYLSEIAETVRRYHSRTEREAALAETVWRLEGALAALAGEAVETQRLTAKRDEAAHAMDPAARDLLAGFDELKRRYQADEISYEVRGREIRTPGFHTSLAGTRVPRVCLPGYRNPGERLRWLMLENAPGFFPFTAGVFPFKRDDEDPTRMFAGEGDPARTNRRFKYLSRDYPAKRLSTAFDSPTLYGRDPEKRPDIYGKVGTSGVSVCTIEDVRTLYDGFDLLDPKNSVSMTINGPAPIMLAMFLNVAQDQALETFAREHGRAPDPEEAAKLKAAALKKVRGTVQADILKEDQGQNTCIFSTEFALKMMGDIQEYFIEHEVKNFYSVSISGYHIAEAGANPITQAAFTLANGFTYVEYYLSRGMAIDDFAPNLSFFFSNGMDPEYAVINRVARRIWAVTMRDKYGASAASQRLKAHIQTSGRSLHAREIQFNDIRTTLQALTALADNCNSLHTNSYDEAVTTPSEESVRRALAIQLIIGREYGLYKNENLTQGSFVIEELTRLVEEAVLAEFDRLSARGGVIGAMETGYQRSRIQEESLYYETRKADGRLPIIGVNTFLGEEHEKDEAASLDLRRATDEEKQGQLARLDAFQKAHAGEAEAALARLKAAALNGGNIFAELMRAVRQASLGQISQALFETGGQYRRNM